jgi:hypothetical protein
MERALLKPTILSKSHEYHQILSSLGAAGYCFMGTVIDMVEQAVRIGKAAVGQVENPVRSRPRREEVRHLRIAGSYPFEPRAMLRRVHEKGETQMAWKSEWLDPEPAETVSNRRRYALACPGGEFCEL